MTIEPTITKLKNAAELIGEAVNELSALLQSLGTSEQSVPDNESQPSATEFTTATNTTVEPEFTMEDVRGVLSDIARSGNREGVKSLLFAGNGMIGYVAKERVDGKELSQN